MRLNKYQRNLYNNLMELCKDEDGTFYYKDYILVDVKYRIFNYRLASYSDFCKPGALECRGIMFEVGLGRDCPIINPIRLASMPMEKFFNLNECPYTMDLSLDNDNIRNITHKKDGSLISTYIDSGELRLKSKGSIDSDQALYAMIWLEQTKNKRFRDDLYSLTFNYNFTVNLEWCSPYNRIVIGYDSDHLSVLNVRRNDNGRYIPRHIIELDFEEVGKSWTKFEEPKNCSDFIESIPSMSDDIEGFVVELMNGQKIKIKTDKYMKLHHCKDNVNNPRRLFEAVIMEATDDMKSLFYNDDIAMSLIMEMERRVDVLFNLMIATVERFYDENKHLERKEYAIKAQNIEKELMSLIMNLYLGRENDYKAFAVKRPELFGLNFKKDQ